MNDEKRGLDDGGLGDRTPPVPSGPNASQPQRFPRQASSGTLAEMEWQRLSVVLHRFMNWVERGPEKDTPHGHHLKHSQLVEYRQLMAEVGISRDRAMKAEISVRGWVNRVVKDHGLEGLNCRINQENGEIMVFMDATHYTWQQSVEHAEQIAAGRNIWTEEVE